MAKAVIDASVFAKWFVGEPGGEDIRDRFLTGILDLYAPSQILFETCNTIWKRKELSNQDALELSKEVISTGITCSPFTKELAANSMQIARRDRISFYDATYIALAKELNFPLITADEQMVLSAEKNKVRVTKR